MATGGPTPRERMLPKGGSGTAPIRGRTDLRASGGVVQPTSQCTASPAAAPVVATGWRCPSCTGVYAPWVMTCPNCRPDVMQALRKVARLES